jgi:glycerol-3-phosphate O-acyltransferase/dihydroxyacetone phosphate acyltransferase
MRTETHRIAEPAPAPISPKRDPSPAATPPPLTPEQRPGWWPRHLHRILRFIARTYYRVRVVGGEVPARGPVLLVANHPNSLMDGPLLAMAAGRPVRFLAGAPLFDRVGVGWLLRGSGAIPVFRRVDAPELVGRNREMFAAVQDALAGGACVGVFPEGLSNAGPALAPLKTGAARIALGAAARFSTHIPILPVGITLRGRKGRFHADALVVVGKPVRWQDLSTRGEEDSSAVRDLTNRIEEGLARVTVNLRDWDELPLVETAEAVHDAEFGRRRSANPVRWLARMRRAAEALELARGLEQRGGASGSASSGAPAGAPGSDSFAPSRSTLDEALREHHRILQSLSLRPADLHRLPRRSVAVRWTLKNLLFFGVALPLAIFGSAVFALPWAVIRRAEPRYRLTPDREATYRVLASIAAFGTWIFLLSAVTQQLWGWRAASGMLLALPLLGFLTLRIRTRWRSAIADLDRFLLLRGSGTVRSELLAAQRALAERIRTLQARIRQTHRP